MAKTPTASEALEALKIIKQMGYSLRERKRAYECVRQYIADLEVKALGRDLNEAQS